MNRFRPSGILPESKPPRLTSRNPKPITAVKALRIRYKTPLVLGIAELRGSLSIAILMARAVALKTHSEMWCALRP